MVLRQCNTIKYNDIITTNGPIACALGLFTIGQELNTIKDKAVKDSALCGTYAVTTLFVTRY